MKHPRAPLIDRYGRHHTYLRVSVTDRCNFRCLYCMPRNGIPFSEQSSLLTFEEIIRIVRLFAEMGIRKIRLTGGEPLVRKDLDKLIKILSSISGVERVCLTTNGVLLGELAKRLRDAGLASLNISLDSLKPERFHRITGQDRLYEVLHGIKIALQESFDSVKLNMVVIGGVNDDEILDFVRFSLSLGINIRFIEFMPFLANDWKPGLLVPSIEIRKRIQDRYELIPIIPSHNSKQIANEYQIPGIKGTVGFIASMSNQFCKSCNRLRLTSDGGIKTCLFGPVEGNLRDEIRSGAGDDRLESLLRLWIEQKPERHDPMERLHISVREPMVMIGG